MIEVRNIRKSFGSVQAIDGVSATSEEGHVFGLIGTNGAGKSTFMRMICGVMKADEGEILVDGEEVYDHPGVKQQIFYISDDQYFFRNGTPEEVRRFYETYYPKFDREKWEDLMGRFGLEKKRKINTFKTILFWSISNKNKTKKKKRKR